jgi:hypothetical protein
MLCGLLLAASACAPKERIRPLFPPPADLAVEPKPVAGPEIITSAIAAAEYDVALESWGARGWLTVARICRWAKANGMGVSCPAP